MGCDIHTRAEVFDKKKSTDAEPAWHGVKPKIFDNDFFTTRDRVAPFTSGFNHPFTNRPYQGRDYNLFAILANVRNDSGDRVNIFDPSLVTYYGDALLPIAQPRGIPSDASGMWIKECNQWGLDFHSHSWFTLTELIAARENGAFTQPILERGFVSKTSYLALKADGTEPSSWAGGTNTGISEAQWHSRSAAQQAAYGGMILAEWPRIVDRQAAADRIIARLSSIAPRIGERPIWGEEDTRTLETDSVRFVFAFDN